MPRSALLARFQKLLSKREKGLSLIELVVVVAVLTALSAIAIPNFKSFLLKSRQAAASTYVDFILKSANIFLIEEGRWPITWQEIYKYGGPQGLNNSYVPVCNLGHPCNGTQRIIMNDHYQVTFYISSGSIPNYPNDLTGNMFGISAGRVDHTGPSRENLSVMGCATKNRGSRMYLFNEGVYWGGHPWFGEIYDNNNQRLNLCG